MDKAKAAVFASVLGIALLAAPQALRAQVRVDTAGSTIQGDILRGQGRFLEGAAWYERESAKALETQTKAIIEWNREYGRLCEDYDRNQARIEAQKRAGARVREEQLRQKMAERQSWLRTNPNDDDIRSGDALNAMLVDLSNPTISESSWRLAKIELPDGMSIKNLVFRFAARNGDKSALSQGVIALGRLDLEGHWPEYFPLEKMAPELRAYEAAFRKIRDQSLAGRLTVEAVKELDDSIGTLKKKVETAVPSERMYRATARQFVGDLEKAAKMFDAQTLLFAREMISDTQRHEAHTVGELLAFMRKYRLMFAGADKSPETFALYGRLYDLMRKQADKLELKPGQGLAAMPARPKDAKLFSGKYYKAFHQELSWHEAQAKCEEMGGHLAIARNEAEDKFVASLLRSERVDAAWLGATDERVEGRWTWVDGTESRYWNWDQGQPNNKGAGEHYLMIVMLREGKWSDQPDRALQFHPGFVCQWDPSQAEIRTKR